MFDAFTKVVAQADARGQFISTSEIDALAAMVSDSNKRLDSVSRISSNASTIVADAARNTIYQSDDRHLRELYLKSIYSTTQTIHKGHLGGTNQSLSTECMLILI